MHKITDEELEDMARTCIQANIKPWHVSDVPMARFLAIYKRISEADERQSADRFDEGFRDHLDDPDNVESSAHYLPRVGFQSQRQDPYYDRSSWGHRNRSDYWNNAQDSPYAGLTGYSSGGADPWGRRNVLGSGGYGERVLDFPPDLDGAIAWLQQQPDRYTKPSSDGHRQKGSGDIRNRLKQETEQEARDIRHRMKQEAEQAGRDLRHGGKKPRGSDGKRSSDRDFRALYREVFPWLTAKQKTKVDQIRDKDRDMYFLGIPDRVGETTRVVTKGFEYLLRPDGRLTKQS